MIKHPSENIAPELVAALRNLSPEAEELKQLHAAQLAIVYEQNWFQLFVPKALNGLDLPLTKALQREEALAWVDGSLGWTVTLCAGAGWFVGFINPEIIPEFFNRKNVCLAGSGKPTGIAKKINDDYHITGQWDYATGSNAASAFTANCLIEENGVLLKNIDGTPLYKSFIFLPEEVTVKENWKRIGMIATASNRFEVNDLLVNKNRAFIIEKEFAFLKDPIYQYPFLQFAEVTLAVNSSGMAMRFLDLCKDIFLQREAVHLQLKLEDALQRINLVRQEFYNVVDESWNTCIKENNISDILLNNISNISKQLALTALHFVDALYPSCGIQAANPDTEINRVWRNLHTASQHSLFNR